MIGAKQRERLVLELLRAWPNGMWTTQTVARALGWSDASTRAWLLFLVRTNQATVRREDDDERAARLATLTPAQRALPGSHKRHKVYRLRVP